MGNLVIRCWLVGRVVFPFLHIATGRRNFQQTGRPGENDKISIIPALARDKPAKRAVGFLGDFRTYSARFIRFNESAAVGIAGTVIGRNEFGFVAGVSDACRVSGCQRRCFSQDIAHPFFVGLGFRINPPGFVHGGVFIHFRRASIPAVDLPSYERIFLGGCSQDFKDVGHFPFVPFPYRKQSVGGIFRI